MRSIVDPAGKQKHTPDHLGRRNPVPDGLTRVFRDLELDWSLCLALDDRDTIADTAPNHEFGDLQPDEIAATQLAVDREVEQGEVPEIPRQFEAGAHRPYLLWEQRAFLARKPPFVPRAAFRFDSGKLDLGHEISSIRPSRSRRRHCVDGVILAQTVNGRFRPLAAVGRWVPMLQCGPPFRTFAARARPGWWPRSQERT